MMDNLLKDESFAKELLSLKNETSTITKNERIYYIRKQLVVDKGKFFGDTIEISDVTDSYNYTAHLEKAVTERTKEIHNIQRSIISGFANIVEARSGDTGTHIKRTSQYVKIIAESMIKMGVNTDILTDEYISCLVDVAPLHDIGKIYVPDYILNKPDKLTYEEFEIMKNHTINGSSIIEENMRGIETDEYVKMAKEIALFHHEKWNGKGYPYGLSKTEIPLAARIMAVADVYDAIRSKRCYKSSIDLEEAKKIIIEGRGEHFDPDVVDAFLREIDAINSYSII